MMHPLDPEWEHYGDPDREIWSLDKFQPELFPENVCHLRLMLYQRPLWSATNPTGKPDAGKPHVRFEEGE